LFKTFHEKKGSVIWY